MEVLNNILSRDLLEAVMSTGMEESDADSFVGHFQQLFRLAHLEYVRKQRSGTVVFESNESGRLNFSQLTRCRLKERFSSLAFRDVDTEKALAAIEKLISDKLQENNEPVWICGIGRIGVVQKPIWVLTMDFPQGVPPGVW
jgi:hypothetical protein